MLKLVLPPKSDSVHVTLTYEKKIMKIAHVTSCKIEISVPTSGFKGGLNERTQEPLTRFWAHSKCSMLRGTAAIMGKHS